MAWRGTLCWVKNGLDIWAQKVMVNKVKLHWEPSKYVKGLTALTMGWGTTLGEEGSAVACPATNSLIAVSKYVELRRSHLLIQFSLLTEKL